MCYQTCRLPQEVLSAQPTRLARVGKNCPVGGRQSFFGTNGKLQRRVVAVFCTFFFGLRDVGWVGVQGLRGACETAY